ncbi:hypothetical protein BT96DRAFT_1024959 [Gymnopus androsaceus JB14]|uniref:DUF6534 domain-containing protein n=1 Tax=Gymnopus androsaceus JB14 TaxID=1447944 RepID=A0A6A4GV73_9AGAR|nr:hypothetical protein BT96DRAFT_1024959 [Gymnopus androsaceus JB14]
MRRNWILPIAVGCLSGMGWGTMCWVVYVQATHHLITDLTLLLPGMYIWLGGSICADLIITGSMIYYLDLRFRVEHPSDYRAPQRFRRIIVRTMECNLLSLLAQANVVGLFNQGSTGFYYIISDMILAKVYTFSLLVSLNSRPTGNNYGTSKTSLASYRGGDVELNALGDWPHV